MKKLNYQELKNKMGFFKLKAKTPKKKSFWKERFEEKERKTFEVDDDKSQEFDKHIAEMDKEIEQKEKEFNKQERQYK